MNIGDLVIYHKSHVPPEQEKNNGNYNRQKKETKFFGNLGYLGHTQFIVQMEEPIKTYQEED